MTAEELRSLAAAIGETQYPAIRGATDEQRQQAANYLRACADALDAGPAAQVVDVLFDGAQKPAYKALRVLTENEMPDGQLLYPLAMPAPLRLPEPMTDDDVHRVSGAQRDAMLDHIYEYGTGAEGIMQRVTQLARAIETETLRRVKEANE